MHINRYLRHSLTSRLKLTPESKTHYDIVIPSILGDEKSLQKLVSKEGLEVTFVTVEGSSPPVTRRLQKTEAFSSFENFDTFADKMEKKLVNANVFLTHKHSHPAMSFIVPNIRSVGGPEVEGYMTASVLGKFVRKDDQNLTPDALFPQLMVSWNRSFNIASIHRNNTDPRDVWTIAVLYQPGQCVDNSYTVRLEDKVMEILRGKLGCETFEHRIHIV